MQLLARGAEAVLRRQDAQEVEATLDEAAGALAEVDAPPWALWPLHSARGALAQSRGRNAEVVLWAGGDRASAGSAAAEGGAGADDVRAEEQLDNSQMSRVYALVTQALAPSAQK